MIDKKHSNNPMVVKSDKLAHQIYQITKNFPKDEVYGLTSQMRRAAVSVPVNIIEGFARKGSKSYRQFLLISYGSLQELKYFLEFSLEESLINKDDFEKAYNLSEECAKMLWSTIDKIDNNLVNGK